MSSSSSSSTFTTSGSSSTEAKHTPSSDTLNNKKRKTETSSAESKKTSLTVLDQAVSVNSVSDANLKWLNSCPNIEEMQSLLRRLLWLEKLQKCMQCGSIDKRKNLRYDVVSPYGDGSKLCCHECWDAWSSPESLLVDEHSPGYKKEWPKECIKPKKISYDGAIYDKHGKYVGEAKGYNPNTHTAKRVELVGQPQNAEAGILEPGDTVRRPSDSENDDDDNEESDQDEHYPTLADEIGGCMNQD